MKNAVRFLTFFFVLAVFLNLSAQEKTPTFTGKTPEKKEVFNSQDYRDWKKIEFYGYSLYLPKNFNLEKTQGFDATLWEYKDVNYSFAVIYGPYAPTSGMVGENIVQNRRGLLQIEEIQAKIWSYKNTDPDEEYPYSIGINFEPRGSKVSSVAIILHSKEENGQDIGKKIFHSIQFKNPEKEDGKPKRKQKVSKKLR